MSEIILGCALLLGALVALFLQRLYSIVPLHELKRLAAHKDHLALGLYRVATYGQSLRLLLWSVVVLAMPAGFVLLATQLPLPILFAMMVVVSALAFVILPSLQLSRQGAQFASLFSPPLAGVLRHMHAPLQQAAGFISRYRSLTLHTHLYEKEDLLALITEQKDQAHNRILDEELELAQRALIFADKKAAEIVQPRPETYLVNADDSIGPVLLDQLHKKHQKSFLVYKNSKENIVGSLLMADAVKATHGGRVGNLVRSDLMYVHEDFNLHHVLTAFQKTGHQLAIVINSFEECIGTITLDAILHELLGDTFSPDDINYESRSTVASFKLAQDVDIYDEEDQVVETEVSSNQTQEAPADSASIEERSSETDTETSFPEATEVIE